MTRIGLSLKVRLPFIVTGAVHVLPWSDDFERTVPGLNVFSHAAYTVPSFATASCGSNCQPTFLQAIPHTNTVGPQVVPLSLEARTRMLVPGQLCCGHSCAPIPVTAW